MRCEQLGTMIGPATERPIQRVHALAGPARALLGGQRLVDRVAVPFISWLSRCHHSEDHMLFKIRVRIRPLRVACRMRGGVEEGQEGWGSRVVSRRAC